MACGHDCSGCSGCSAAASLELTEPEIAFLELLGQTAFLPVCRRRDDLTPVYPGGDGQSSAVLQCLEKKHLISLDYDLPLKGFSHPVYDSYPLQGSMALTLRGQQVLELLEIQGAE